LKTKAAILAIKQQVGLGPYQSRAALHQQGKEYKARCLWHDDRNPTLSFYKKNGEWLWQCFACKIGGDVLAFVQKADNISITEALEKVCCECGIRRDDASEQEKQLFYDSQTATAALDKAASYLASRGIPLELARERGLGFFEHPSLGPAVAIPYTNEVVKIRALNPKSKSEKFRHLSGRPSSSLLYGAEQIACDFIFNPDVFVTESELDALTLRAHGFNAVSVSSAATCLQHGKLRIEESHLEKLKAAERIFLALDMDETGQQCADAFEKEFPAYQVFRITWPYGGKNSTDPKDIGEIYSQLNDGFKARIEQLREQAVSRPPAWRRLFKNGSQMSDEPLNFLVNDFLLEESCCMFGGLSGHGKTLIGLSLSKAFVNGTPLFGFFTVPEKVPVLYLIPESGEKSFKLRMRAFGLVRDDDSFLVRTFSDGPMVSLSDPLLLQAAKGRAVMLDTAIRFSDALDESSAAENRRLAENIFLLLGQGARAVIGLHHSPKSFERADCMTLENILRGSGDIGAMLGAAYGVRMVDREKSLLHIECVKPRDFEPVAPFQIQGRPYIDQSGDFVMTGEPGAVPSLARVFEEQKDSDAVIDPRYGRACKLFEKGKSVQAVKEALKMRKETVVNWRQRWEQERHEQREIVMVN